MTTPIQNLRSNVDSKRPTASGLAFGQIAINYNENDPAIYLRGDSDALVKIAPVYIASGAPNATPASGGTSGNSIGEQWLDISTSPATLKLWDGSNWLSPGATSIASGVIVDADVNASAAIAGTKIDPDFGSQTIETTGVINAGSGTAAAPSVSVGTTDNGLYSPGTDQVALSTNGTQALYINADGDILVADGNRMEIDEIRARDGDGLKLYDDAGNGIFVKDGGSVGIGTSSPAGSQSGPVVHVRGENAGIRLNSTLDGGWGYIEFADEADTVKYISGYRDINTTYNICPGTDLSSNSGIHLDSSGRVGIGTSAPDADLHVQSSAAARIRIQSGSASDAQIDLIPGGTSNPYYIVVNSSRNLIFQDYATERARIDSSGRLLVGTTSTQADTYLVVEGQSGAATGPGTMTLARGSNTPSDGNGIGQIFFTDTDHTTSQATPKSAASILCQRDGGTWTSGSSMPSRLVFSTTADGASSPTERMRITSGGISRFVSSSLNIEIYPAAGSIYRTTASAAGIAFSTTSILPTDNAGQVNDNTNSLGNPSYRWSVVYAGTGTINTSDANLKQDVESLEQVELNAAVAIKKLVKKFRFTDAVAAKGDDARIHVGVIAQEVEQAFVDEGLDPRRYALFCEDTLEDGSKRLGIRYDELLAFVIAAL